MDDSDISYRVVINGEEQYALWPAENEIPDGWQQARQPGSKDECLAFVEEHWTDMRPLSLRRQSDAQPSAHP
jgi:MbtH protein